MIGHFDTYARAYHKNLEINQYDRDFFAREIQEPTYAAGFVAPVPTIISHRLIRDAASYFKEQVGRDLAQIAGNDDKLRYVARIQKIVAEHMSVVVVWSDDEDEAATVFETLNDRGIGLSAPDLVRNLVLKRAEPGNGEEINQNWAQVLAIEPEAAAEDFLCHYWLSKAGDVKARSLYREIKAHISTNNLPSLDLSRDLSAKAETYASILSAEDADPEMKELLNGLGILGAKPLLPPLLSAYKVGNLNDKRAFLANLMTLYVRHVVIGGLEGSRLETFLYDLARRLRQDGNFGAARTSMIRFAPDDGSFAAAFRVASVSKGTAARYILREIEYNRRPRGGVVQINEAFKSHGAATLRTAPDDLVFSTSKETPLNPKNLYNRVLAPACDAIRIPRVSWHSFRHSNATPLGEVGESLKTAQAILGHSDLETTLNTYMHAIPDSQRRAVEKVAEVLCPIVPDLGEATAKITVN